MANTYGIGNGVRVAVKFKLLSSGVFVDPSTVKVLVKNPSLVTTTYQYTINAELQKSDIGQYFLIVDANAAGDWKYRWEGSGTNEAASEGSFIISPSVF